eukprot:46172-Prorocentrum_lima.AAC.1
MQKGGGEGRGGERTRVTFKPRHSSWSIILTEVRRARNCRSVARAARSGSPMPGWATQDRVRRLLERESL